VKRKVNQRLVSSLIIFFKNKLRKISLNFIFSKASYSVGTENCLICTTAHCKRCSAVNACIECKTGFYLLGSGVPASCVSCGEGYYRTSPSSINSCSACPTNCRACDTVGVCISCAPEYYLEGTNCVTCNDPGKMRSVDANKKYICESCVAGCSSNKCKSTTYCEECAECDSFALALEDRSVCVLCPAGSIGPNNICYCETECTPNCYICSNWNTCETCVTGYYKNCEKKCSKCSNNCLECTEFAECSVCSAGYKLSGGSCYECLTDGQSIDSTNCLICSVPNCKACNPSNTCSLCRDGFYLLNGGNTCDECKVGKWINGITCKTCNDVNCVECSTAATCTRCNTGYYLNTVGACTLCREDDQDSCVSAIGFRRELDCAASPSGICSECAITHCRVCSPEDICLECQSGYYIDISKVDKNYGEVCIACNGANQQIVKGKYCYGCQDCTPNCVLCESENWCDTCENGYYKDSKKLCVRCPDSCLTCQMINGGAYVECLTCQNAYFLTQNKKACVLCTENGVVQQGLIKYI
jgi:hypothetical protein